MHCLWSSISSPQYLMWSCLYSKQTPCWCHHLNSWDVAVLLSSWCHYNMKLVRKEADNAADSNSTSGTMGKCRPRCLTVFFYCVCMCVCVYVCMCVCVCVCVFEGMRTVTTTTPQTSSTSCTPKKGEACLTPGRMCWDTCSRSAQPHCFTISHWLNGSIPVCSSIRGNNSSRLRKI